MTRSRLMHWILCCLAVAAVGVAGCSADTTTSGESTGSLDLNLELAPGVVINEVKWVISRPLMEDMMGTIDTSAPGATASVEVFGLPPGDGYTVTLTAMVEGEDTTCGGSANFSVEVGVSTPVMVMLNCKRPETLGGVRVNGKLNICAELAKVIVSPLQTSVGNDIDLSALAQDVDYDQEAIRYLWTATGGSIADPTDRITTYTCEEVGDHTIVIRVSDDPEEFGEFCMDDWDVQVTCVEGEGDLCEGNMCDDDDTECSDSSCDQGTGQCVETPINEGGDCMDGEGTCMGGDCVVGNLCDGNMCDDDDTECNDSECDPTDGLCFDTPINEGGSCQSGEGTCNAGVCEATGEIALPMVVDDHYFDRSGFGPTGEPLHTEDNGCPERAGEENGLCHRFIWDGMDGAFTGTFWTDGEGFVDLNGLAVEMGATEVSFYAWGATGGEVITFGAGIGDAALDGAEARSLITLTTAPTLYTVSLAVLAGYTDVYGPFIWAADTTGNPSGFEFYVDDIQWIQAPPVPLGPIDFEPGGLGAGFTWGVFENVDNPPLEFIANPDPTGANTSATVAKFTARQAGAAFAGTITQDLPTFTLDASNSCVKIKVWKSVVSDVGLKFEMGAASTGELKVANTVTNQWEELTFDFSVKIGEPSSTDITGFVVFPDFDARTQENVIYFDDIVFLDSTQCP